MKEIFFVISLIGILGFAESAIAEESEQLNGKWEQVSVDCENGKSDAFVRKVQRALAKEPRPQMEIRNGYVNLSTLANHSKNGYCEVVIDETWKITDNTYTPLTSKISQKNEMGAKCPANTRGSATGVTRRYEKIGDVLKLYLKVKNTHSKSICGDGTLIATYNKISD